MCGETEVDGSKLYLLMNIISNHIKDLKIDDKFVLFKQGFEAMDKKFEKYWNQIESYSKISHVLDPRFKLEFLEEFTKLSTIAEVKLKYDVFFKKFSKDDNSRELEKNRTKSNQI